MYILLSSLVDDFYLLVKVSQAAIGGLCVFPWWLGRYAYSSHERVIFEYTPVGAGRQIWSSQYHQRKNHFSALPFDSEPTQMAFLFTLWLSPRNSFYLLSLQILPCSLAPTSFLGLPLSKSFTSSENISQNSNCSSHFLEREKLHSQAVPRAPFYFTAHTLPPG